jgi:hypothetical protein
VTTLPVSAANGKPLSGGNMKEDTPPARKVVTRAPHKTVRLLNLIGILEGPVECESSLERDFIYRAALCPGIVGIQQQPFRLQLSMGHSYVPDFLLTHRDGRKVVAEVKLASKIERQSATFDEAREALAAKGVGFMVVSEEAIQKGNAHARAALILRYRKGSVSDTVHASVTKVLGAKPAGLPLGSLTRQCGASPQDIFRLIAQRVLVTSPALPIDGSARVFLTTNMENSRVLRIENWIDCPLWRANA